MSILKGVRAIFQLQNARYGQSICFRKIALTPFPEFVQ
jgi:hypothetical protein